MAERRPRGRRRFLLVLLVAPFAGALTVPFYDRVDPRLAGVPFFYWYQLAWIPLGAAITAVLYYALREPDA